ncbi:MAG: hypothetical protein NZV14_03055 [Bryobacteraceae bacterium]|nr:hypothetical protein [Bryobacteraceae bacterium]MDW8377113.1 hypothetical protein [Bryobacterales bacterium]
MRTRRLTIVAEDPSLQVGSGDQRRILTAEVEIPYEELAEGPRGHRVHVIDYDSTSDTIYAPLPAEAYANGQDPFLNPTNETILNNPNFHAQNVYAVVMRTLARFERALGRRVEWSFGGHQIYVAPHAFSDANAFYSDRDRALLFGYFPAAEGNQMIFTCLSHDVIVHEVTHALLDGLRQRYTDPSSPDQAAFHEGFADVVALLSAFSIPEVVRAALESKRGVPQSVSRSLLTKEALRKSVLLGLALQLGSELSGVRGEALRRSVQLRPGVEWLQDPFYCQAHRRGEIFVAAMMNAFVEVLSNGLATLGDVNGKGALDRGRVVQECADTAERLLNICIRAIDYCPPTDLRFGDFLSALITSDQEIVPDDSRYRFRDAIRANFQAFGIAPASGQVASGAWEPPVDESQRLDYTGVHFEALRQHHDEVFRFLWQNRGILKVFPDAYTKVLSVRPCSRVGPDGFILEETVAEYYQVLTLKARELKRLKIEKPANMPEDLEIKLYGGGALIFDEYGHLKYHVRNRIDNRNLQQERLQSLWDSGYFDQGFNSGQRFSALHLARMVRWPLGYAGRG